MTSPSIPQEPRDIVASLSAAFTPGGLGNSEVVDLLLVVEGVLLAVALCAITVLLGRSMFRSRRLRTLFDRESPATSWKSASPRSQASTSRRLTRTAASFTPTVIWGILMPALGVVALLFSVTVLRLTERLGFELATAVPGALATMGALAFVSGSRLLVIHERIHGILPRPRPQGAQLRWLKRAGSTQARWGFCVITLLAMATHYAGELGLPPTMVASVTAAASHTHSRIALVCLAFAGLMIFAAGTARELNRHRINLLGSLISAVVAMLAFAQTLSIHEPLSTVQHLLELTALVTLAALLLAFFVGAIQMRVGELFSARRAQLGERRRWSDYVSDRHWLAAVRERHTSARHSISNAVVRMGFDFEDVDDMIRLATAASESMKTISNQLGTIKTNWKTAGSEIEREVVALAELDVPPTEMQQTLEATLKSIQEKYGKASAVQTSIHVSWQGRSRHAMVPRVISSALDRVLENALRKRPKNITVAASTTKQHLEILITDDGDPISSEARKDILTRRVGGLWAARRILTDLGGHLEILSQPKEAAIQILVPFERPKSP
jgi:hypothetical protein